MRLPRTSTSTRRLLSEVDRVLLATKLAERKKKKSVQSGYLDAVVNKGLEDDAALGGIMMAAADAAELPLAKTSRLMVVAVAVRTGARLQLI